MTHLRHLKHHRRFIIKAGNCVFRISPSSLSFAVVSVLAVQEHETKAIRKWNFGAWFFCAVGFRGENSFNGKSQKISVCSVFVSNLNKKQKMWLNFHLDIWFSFEIELEQKRLFAMYFSLPFEFSLFPYSVNENDETSLPTMMKGWKRTRIKLDLRLKIQFP